MEEIIQSIMDAEKSAEEMIRAAREQAKAILAQADDRSGEIRDQAKAEIKLRREQTLALAERTAEREFAESLAEGEAQGAEIERLAEAKIEAAADLIVGRVTNGNR